jgi:hypothetical protein
MTCARRPTVLLVSTGSNNEQLLTGITLMVALTCHAADPMYNETADAKAEIRQALVQAAAAGVPVLVVFGVN